jgi:hypothetical protein
MTFNEDGKRDIAVGNYQSGSVTLLLNETSIATQLEEVEAAGHELSLDVFPNPFSSSAEIQFSLINASDIKLELFDLQGKKIKTIAEGNFSDGNHQLILECNDMESGIYLLQFVTGLSSISSKNHSNKTIKLVSLIMITGRAENPNRICNIMNS